MRTWTLLLSRGPYRGDVCARRACETRAGMSFETAATVFGAVLMGGALLSGIARRSFLSLTAIFVLVGFALGHGGLEVLDFSATSRFVEDLALVALVVILFRDGLE